MKTLHVAKLQQFSEIMSKEGEKRIARQNIFQGACNYKGWHLYVGHVVCPKCEMTRLRRVVFHMHHVVSHYETLRWPLVYIIEAIFPVNHEPREKERETGTIKKMK